jgi:class 3 adenylate cyclase
LYECIKSFLPREISTRFSKLVQSGHKTSEALEIILQPKRVEVACLYSDIRGFTKKVRDDLNIANEAIFPSQVMAMEFVEQSQGIPRPVGDLVFAYFDHISPDTNLLLAVGTGINIVNGQKQLNESLTSDRRISRYVLVSFGEAIVGNGGGKFSSRDIYPVGNPSNILSRIDVLSKDLKLKNLVVEDEIILTSIAILKLKNLIPNLEVRNIDIKVHGLEIRDFPEESIIGIVKTTESNAQMIENKLNDYRGNNYERRSANRARI